MRSRGRGEGAPHLSQRQHAGCYRSQPVAPRAFWGEDSTPVSGDRDIARIASVGVDLGGTNIRSAVFDDGMQILGRSERQTRAQEDADDVIRRMATCVREALEQASVAAGEGGGGGVGAGRLTERRDGGGVLAANLGGRDVA